MRWLAAPALLLPLHCFTCFTGANGQEVAVTSPFGVIVGNTTEDGVDRFLGIHFAEVPERFVPSVLLETSMNETVNATEFGPQCIQPTFPGAPAAVAQSEDCLFLNIWRPNTNATSLTTMVWIPGGGFVSGSGSEPLYDGTAMAQKHGVIVVTLNYRLGIFGWLANATDNGKGGMNGIHDQINALQWLKGNIASFGGNPDDITIFGESAGGVSVCLLAVSPLASSLFKRAIIQSGQCVSDRLKPRTVEEGEAATATVLNVTGADSVEELASLPAEELVLPPTGTMVWPTLDGWVLSEQPARLYQGDINAHDMMLGANTYDDISMLGFPPEAYVSRAAGLEQYIHNLFDDDYGVEASNLVVEAYSPSLYNDSDVAAYAQFNGDFLLLCFGHELGALIADHIEGDAYLYTFGHFFEGNDIGSSIVEVANITDPNWGSHTGEIPFVFSNLDQNFFRPVFVPPTLAEVNLAEEIMARWVNFAKTGNPSAELEGTDWMPVPQDLQANTGASEVTTMFFQAGGGEMKYSQQKVDQCSTIPGVSSFPSSPMLPPSSSGGQYLLAGSPYRQWVVILVLAIAWIV